MTPSPHDHDLAYAEEELGELDLPGFVREDLPDGSGVLVRGACPRCRGRTQKPFRRMAPGAGTKGWWERLARRADGEDEADPLAGEVLFCECGHSHPGMPAEVVFVGCGASWRVRR